MKPFYTYAEGIISGRTKGTRATITRHRWKRWKYVIYLYLLWIDKVGHKAFPYRQESGPSFMDEVDMFLLTSPYKWAEESVMMTEFPPEKGNDWIRKFFERHKVKEDNI